MSIRFCPVCDAILTETGDCPDPRCEANKPRPDSTTLHRPKRDPRGPPPHARAVDREESTEPPQVGGVQPRMTSDPLTNMLYVLLRDEILPGHMEDVMLRVERTWLEPGRHSVDLTNRFLADYAANLAGRIRMEAQEFSDAFAAERLGYAVRIMLDDPAGTVARIERGMHTKDDATYLVKRLREEGR